MSMDQWNEVTDSQQAEKLIVSLKERNINGYYLKNAQEAMSKVQQLIPAGSEVAKGSSTTLDQIGFTSLLQSGDSGWVNLGDAVSKESDQQKRTLLRKQNLLAQYFVGSVNAITQDGILMAVDQTGSRVGAYLYAAQKLILISGVNKVVPTLEDGFKRIREYVYPLEDARAQKAYGSGSYPAKWAIIEKELDPERIHLLLVDQPLGF